MIDDDGRSIVRYIDESPRSHVRIMRRDHRWLREDLRRALKRTSEPAPLRDVEELPTETWVDRRGAFDPVDGVLYLFGRRPETEAERYDHERLARYLRTTRRQR